MTKLTTLSRFGAAAAFAALVISTPSVQAIPYILTYADGGGNVASGVIDVVGGAAVSGTLDVTGGAATGLPWVLSPGAGGDSFFNWDNAVFTPYDPATETFLTSNGLLFTAPGYELNIWGNSPGNYSFYGTVGGTYIPLFDGGSASLTAAPDNGAAIALFGGTLLCLPLIRRKLLAAV